MLRWLILWLRKAHGQLTFPVYFLHHFILSCDCRSLVCDVESEALFSSQRAQRQSRGDFYGTQGAEPLQIKIADNFWRFSPLRSSCMGFTFRCLLTLLSKYFAFLWSFLHCYMVIKTFLIIDYTMSVFSEIIISAL